MCCAREATWRTNNSRPALANKTALTHSTKISQLAIFTLSLAGAVSGAVNVTVITRPKPLSVYGVAVTVATPGANAIAKTEPVAAVISNTQSVAVAVAVAEAVAEAVANISQIEFAVKEHRVALFVTVAPAGTKALAVTVTPPA